MAKVMISLPDELLLRLDARARERSTSRSGLLRDLAEQDLAAAQRRRQERVAGLLEPGRYGGRGAVDLRRLRQGR